MHPITRKLSIFADFTHDEESAIALAFSQTFKVAANRDLARQDDPPDSVLFLLDGFGSRYKLLEDGGRQIVAFLLPGDACDEGISLLERRDHSVGALSPCRVGRISDAALRHLTEQYPKIRDAFRWATLVEEAISREWLTNIGHRQATPRMAHLICETYHRLQALGLAEGFNFELPLTQQQLADALGMSVVHANRTLQELRHLKLIAFGDKRLTILNLEKLTQLGDFDPGYLHLQARYRAVGQGTSS